MHDRSLYEMIEEDNTGYGYQGRRAQPGAKRRSQICLCLQLPRLICSPGVLARNQDDLSEQRQRHGHKISVFKYTKIITDCLLCPIYSY